MAKAKKTVRKVAKKSAKAKVQPKGRESFPGGPRTGETPKAYLKRTGRGK